MAAVGAEIAEVSALLVAVLVVVVEVVVVVVAVVVVNAEVGVFGANIDAGNQSNIDARRAGVINTSANWASPRNWFDTSGIDASRGVGW